MRQASALPILFAVAAGLLATLFGCGGSGPSAYVTSVGRMAKLELGLEEYINDYDDALPLSTSWMDALTPYVKDPTDFRSPAVEAKGYGYAFNSALSAVNYNQIQNPDQMVALFDSTNLARNASDAVQSLPNPPRYGKKNTLGYADGRTQDGDLSSPPVPPINVSVSRVKQLDLGLLIYANDYDEVLPLNNSWMDALTPYVRNQEDFRSPAVEAQNSAEYGYAFNSELVGVAVQSLASPSTTISVFDSTVLTRNATALTTTLPTPGRYSGQNAVGYADGHATAK